MSGANHVLQRGRAGEFDTEDQWMKLLETQIPEFDAILRQNNVLKTAIHVFYESIPTKIQDFPAANPELMDWATEKLLNETSETPAVCLFCGNPYSDVTNTSEAAGFVCNCCSYSRGNRLIGLWVDLFVDLQWKTGEKGSVWNIVLMDWFWVLRCRADVVAEAAFHKPKRIRLVEEDCALRFHTIKESEQQKEAVCKICGNTGNDSDFKFCNCCNKGFHKSCLNGQPSSEPTGSLADGSEGQEKWFCEECTTRSKTLVFNRVN
ncbi:uncharacterized protein [Blastocystis hominis]|uniref:PHD-type domain-containing protein n=1 Tax=Blastocystis hominis TaxID=12968 RepID=D8M653_BLAHO|nr:uncharacterized protein [Blastocystis hominis]CBK23762.2 unnamed protein product [Blastocystis hominis]|eukprot:XP_012897810.1 uncharacterized protein [Blastocystis hominis]